MSDKIEPTQEEIQPSTQPEAELEPHSAESEELPWCGIQVNNAVPGTDEAASDAAETESAE